jgi:hypothetical protein
MSDQLRAADELTVPISVRTSAGRSVPTAPTRETDANDVTQAVPPAGPGGDPAPAVPLDESGLHGELFHTVLGSLLGIYTWECDRVPSVGDLRAAMERRVQVDCGKVRPRPRHTYLAGWHGGWTPEGVGIFAADIWGQPRRGSCRAVGRANVVVRTPDDRGLCVPQGIAC